jgi:excinuclease ABC subunit A
VKVGGKSITELVNISVSELLPWVESLKLTEHEEQIAKRILTEIRNRLHYLMDVGLGYLTLNRTSNSLSGGESQRINLATSLGSSLVGSLYILDEPSIGLHSRDTERLIKVLKQLRDLGNTVIVVEHDEEIIRSADWLIDIGPEAGRLGGEVVYQGPVPSGPHQTSPSGGFLSLHFREVGFISSQTKTVRSLYPASMQCSTSRRPSTTKRPSALRCADFC